MNGMLRHILATAAVLMLLPFPAVDPLPCDPEAQAAARAAAVITPLPTGLQNVALNAVDWSPGTDDALIAGDNGTVVVYNTTTGFRPHPQNTSFAFEDVAYAPSRSPARALLVGREGRASPPDAGLAMTYDGSAFTRLDTAGYTNFTGIAWDPNSSVAYIVGERPDAGVVMAYSGLALTEVLADPDRRFLAICWAGPGAYIAAYDNMKKAPAVLYFNGTALALGVDMPPGLNFDPTDISWSSSLGIGACVGALDKAGTMLRFNSTAALAVSDPSPQGPLYGAAWGRSRPLALVAGEDTGNDNDTNGLLYSFNGSSLVLESGNRYNPLRDASWHRSDGYALVVGENATVLRYTAPNNRPWCTITSPDNLAEVCGTVSVTGAAWDPDADPIVSVQVNVDHGAWQPAVLAGGAWSYQWETLGVPNGNHNLYARSYDGLEHSFEPQCMVTVINPNHPPAVSIERPTEGSRISGLVAIQGTASDQDAGDIVWAVEVAIDDGHWGNASGTANWSISWDTSSAQDGPHLLRARAYDGEAYSDVAVRNITVQNGAPNLPPSCAFTSPAPGSAVSGEVLVQGTASDPENALSAVYLRVDGGSWQTASGTTSWSLLWDSRPATGGQHVLFARAFDGAQNSSDVSLSLVVRHAPVCTINSPAQGATVTGLFMVEGTATDSDPGDVISSVKVKIDSGDWVTASGTTSWSYRWNTSAFSVGEHVLRARCSDGTMDSAEVSRSVKVRKPPAPVTLSAPTDYGEHHMVLVWTRNVDADFARYEAFISEAEGAPLSGLSPRVLTTQSVTSLNFTGLQPRTTYWFRVRVVDNAGCYTVSNEVYGTTLRENLPPVASLTASRTRATVGEAIIFDAGGSYDQDRGGRIIRFEWDFEGRGRFETGTGAVGSARHEFAKAGNYTVQVRVWDDRGSSAIGAVNVIISERPSGGPDALAVALGAGAIIVVMVALAFLWTHRRPPKARSYYEERVHGPAVRRRKERWPKETEMAGPPIVRAGAKERQR